MYANGNGTWSNSRPGTAPGDHVRQSALTAVAPSNLRPQQRNGWPSSLSNASDSLSSAPSHDDGRFKRQNLVRGDHRGKLIVRVFIDRLSTNVTDFDLAAILPPHTNPVAIDFPPPQRTYSAHAAPCSSRWVCYAFDQLDVALDCWNHLRQLHVCGHLKHLCASPDCEGKGLVFDVSPSLEDIEMMLDAAKNIDPHPAPNLPPFVHITNLLYSTTAQAIATLIPAALAPHARVELLRPGAPLSKDPPQPQAYGARHVGRAQIYFETLAHACQFYDIWQSSIRKSREAMRLRHYGADVPTAIAPTVMFAIMQARTKLGDDVLQALLESAFIYPKPLAPVPAPAPSSARSSQPAQHAPTPPLTNSSDDTISSSSTSTAPSHSIFSSTPAPFPPSRLGAPTRRNTSSAPPPITSASALASRSVFLVFMTNIAPTVTASDLESAILYHPNATTFHPPISVHLCPQTRNGLFAYKTVLVRPVKYVFKSSDHARAFMTHVRRLDKAGDLDSCKAEPHFRVSAYLAKVEEGTDMESRWRM